MFTLFLAGKIKLHSAMQKSRENDYSRTVIADVGGISNIKKLLKLPGVLEQRSCVL